MDYLSANGVDNVKGVNKFLVRVFNWMILAMLLSGGAAFYVASNKAAMIPVYENFMLLIFLEVGLVFAISFLINRISSFVAGLLFIIYSLANGVTLSVIFLVYNPMDIVNAFLITAGTFVFMSFYGYKTGSDLTSFGKVMIMGLFGIILASIVNFFIGSSGMGYIISWISVVVFTGLIAYDMQMLRMMGEQSITSEEGTKKMAIMGALNLYLDFVNLFLNILRLFGSRD